MGVFDRGDKVEDRVTSIPEQSNHTDLTAGETLPVDTEGPINEDRGVACRLAGRVNEHGFNEACVVFENGDVISLGTADTKNEAFIAHSEATTAA